MAQQILDYIWINSEYEIELETITTTIFYNSIDKLPSFDKQNIVLKPVQMFPNPSTQSPYDYIVFCDVYEVNRFCYPSQIHLSEQNRRKEFDQYMEQFASDSFKITQCYKADSLYFRQHKDYCKYMNIDIFSKPNEYSIYCKKKDAYNMVWITRYILYMFYDYSDLVLTELKLISNVDEDITEHMKMMDMSCIDELMEECCF